MKKVLTTVLLNLLFFPLFVIASATLIPTLSLLVALQAPFIGHRRAMRCFRNYIKIYGHAVLALLFPFVRIQTEAEDNRSTEPCIYVCNHRSTSDPFLMAKLPGEIVQVVNDWPFRLPVLGRFAKWAGYLSVKEMPVEEFIERSAKLLAEGVCIAAFPEGTRSACRTMGPFHSTVFRLALETGVPLVPVCIAGNEDIPHKGSLVLHPGRIRVRRLAAIEPNAFKEMSPFKLKNHVHEVISNELDKMELAG